MIKILSASADAYITDKIIAGSRKTDANTGLAGTLDLYKIYGMNKSGSVSLTELTRLLIKFDLEPLKTLYNAGKLDPSMSSFNAHVKLFDVYGGQPTPKNFKVVIHPLSKSFSEGQGRDIARYDDIDVCNFLSASVNDIWVLSGAASGGGVGSNVDYLTTMGSTTLESNQIFSTGVEDAWLDVTTVLSATLCGQIADNGFRVALTGTLENDNYTYFVKRFASRQAYDKEKHPQLIVKWDDSVLDDTQLLEVDASCNLFLYNKIRGNLTTISGVSGSNCIVLRLTAPISGGYFNTSFTGSQHQFGVNYVTGTYVVNNVLLPSSDANVQKWLNETGSVKLTPIWETTTATALHTGSALTFYPPDRSNVAEDVSNNYVSVTNVPAELQKTQVIRCRVNVANRNNPRIFLTKTPIKLPGIVIRDAHYSVRDIESNKTIIDFDTNSNSTRLSSDADGMFFDLDGNNLLAGHTYVIDVLFTNSSERKIFSSVSPNFRVKC